MYRHSEQIRFCDVMFNVIEHYITETNLFWMYFVQYTFTMLHWDNNNMFVEYNYHNITIIEVESDSLYIHECNADYLVILKWTLQFPNKFCKHFILGVTYVNIRKTIFFIVIYLLIIVCRILQKNVIYHFFQSHNLPLSFLALFFFKNVSSLNISNTFHDIFSAFQTFVLHQSQFKRNQCL